MAVCHLDQCSFNVIQKTAVAALIAFLRQSVIHTKYAGVACDVSDNTVSLREILRYFSTLLRFKILQTSAMFNIPF